MKRTTKKLNTVKTWDEIQQDFENMQKMSCVPSFKKLPKDWVTDENQSVKWNREQVEQNNKDYLKAVADLNTKKNKARDQVYEDICVMIQDEVGYRLDKKSAEEIWNYAYEAGHGFGIREVKTHLDEIMELVRNILSRQS